MTFSFTYIKYFSDTIALLNTSKNKAKHTHTHKKQHREATPRMKVNLLTSICGAEHFKEKIEPSSSKGKIFKLFILRNTIRRIFYLKSRNKCAVLVITIKVLS